MVSLQPPISSFLFSPILYYMFYALGNSQKDEYLLSVAPSLFSCNSSSFGRYGGLHFFTSVHAFFGLSFGLVFFIYFV